MLCQTVSVLNHRFIRPAIGITALVAVVAIIAVAVVVITRGPGPSLGAAARLGLKRPTGPAPSAAGPLYLNLSFSGVTFPNYERMNAVATGQIRNTIGGRAAVTVLYRLKGGQRISYTVLSGDPVKPPLASQRAYFQGVGMRIFRTAGLTVATLVRHGRTTVLAGSGPEDTVLGFAAEPVLAPAGSPDIVTSG
jgi:hypothetical protein